MDPHRLNTPPTNGGQVLRDINGRKPAQLRDLKKRAAGLKARIEREDKLDPEIDRGPYFLRDVTGHDIWVTGLPLAGIAEALDCFERELALDPGTDIGVAWADFGAWMRG